jgi:lipid A 4'-phosphatase
LRSINHFFMSTQPVTHLPAVKTPILFWQMTVLFALLALVPTFWPAIDIGVASALGGNAGHEAWWWVDLINLYIPSVFRFLVFASAALLAVTWIWTRWAPFRMSLAFLAFAIAIGPGAVVNAGFKDNWQRARPYQVVEFGGTQQFTRAAVMTDQCDNNCSFVSGHVACGFFLMSLMLVQPRRRKGWAATGTIAGFLIGFARISDSAHWLSDVLWAAPITMLCSWVVWKALLRVPQLTGKSAVP